jgi:hypothetical protein
MEVELEVGERLQLLNVIPRDGLDSIMALKTLRQLLEDLSLNEEEIAEFGVVPDRETGQVRWNPEKAKSKKFAISKGAEQIIVVALQKLLRESKLRVELLPLWEKFVEDRDES